MTAHTLRSPAVGSAADPAGSSAAMYCHTTRHFGCDCYQRNSTDVDCTVDEIERKHDVNDYNNDIDRNRMLVTTTTKNGFHSNFCQKQ